MSYGQDQRRNTRQNLVIKWHLIEALWINNHISAGSQKYESAFFTSRNYELNFTRNTFSLDLETSDNIRVGLDWNWGDEVNISGPETLRENRLELGGDYQIIGKGVLHFDIQYSRHGTVLFRKLLKAQVLFLFQVILL